MPQNVVPLAIPVAPVNVTALQEAINLNAAGTLVAVGNPGGPVVFAAFGSYIVPGLSGQALNTVVRGH